MDKQTTIAFILIGAILVLWLYISSPDPKQQQPKEKNKTEQTNDSVDTISKDSILESKTISEEINTESLTLNNPSIPEEQIIIETQLARVVFGK